jgi:hypothetical protein
VLNSWRFLQQHNRLTLYGYVILENYLHLIASSPDLSKEIGDFKSFTAKEIIKLLKFRGAHTLLEQVKQYKLPTKTGQQYQLWQEGSHPKRIDSDRDDESEARLHALQSRRTRLRRRADPLALFERPQLREQAGADRRDDLLVGGACGSEAGASKSGLRGRTLVTRVKSAFTASKPPRST